jgi:hypothetical protein
MIVPEEIHANSNDISQHSKSSLGVVRFASLIYSNQPWPNKERTQPLVEVTCSSGRERVGILPGWNCLAYMLSQISISAWRAAFVDGAKGTSLVQGRS